MCRHFFQSSVAGCKCRWCGSGRFAGEECPVDDEMRLALASFAHSYGRCWKSRLTWSWNRDQDLGPELRRVRNVIGPSGLRRITDDMLTRY